MTGSPTRASETPWGEYRVGTEPLQVPIGPLRFDLSLVGEELYVAWSRSDPSDAAGSTPPSLERWVQGDDPSVFVRPTLPDRPMVVAPEVPFNLAPKTTARIYVRVPIVARVERTDPAQTLLLEVPSIVMSNTWWGDLAEGELCYWLPTKARRRMAPDEFPPHLVVCPILIENQSADVLRVEKTAVRGEYMSVFTNNGQLWADETVIQYSGHEEGSEISSNGRPPTEALGGELIAAPRNPTNRTLRARTFARLKSLSGL